jgi:23S rRNA (pseudouridine1915-N3)-methyltransferase
MRFIGPPLRSSRLRASCFRSAQPVALCLNRPVKLKIAWIGKTKEPAIQALTDEYLKRISRYAETEGLSLADESALQKLRSRSGTRPAHTIVLLEARGRQLTSEEFAQFLQNHQDRNAQPLVLAIGPADGFSANTRACANVILSLGKMTLAHELARVVLLEQVYRAFTILEGHPYHTGH